jgi:hypothetical protein
MGEITKRKLNKKYTQGAGREIKKGEQDQQPSARVL